MMQSLLPWQQALWRKLTHNGGLYTHAILLKGRAGIGKFLFARLLSKSILCTRPDNNQIACGQCASCNWFEQQSHPNFTLLMPEELALKDNVSDAAATVQAAASKSKKKPSQQITIDQIRNLDDFVYMTGHQEGRRIVMIYPAEAMNTAAANALLKKLEEPPENVVFILVTHQPQQLLPTIRSRCQQIAMPAPDMDTALQWLQQQEQGSLNAEKSMSLLAMSGFSPLSAVVFIESAEQHQQFIEKISTPHAFDAIALAESLQGQNLVMTVDWLQKWCYDLASYLATGKIRYHPHLEARIQAFCKQVKLQDCVAYLRLLNTRQTLVRHPVNSRLFLEEILIQYGQLLDASFRTPDFV